MKLGDYYGGIWNSLSNTLLCSSYECKSNPVFSLVGSTGVVFPGVMRPFASASENHTISHPIFYTTTWLYNLKLRSVSNHCQTKSPFSGTPVPGFSLLEVRWNQPFDGGEVVWKALILILVVELTHLRTFDPKLELQNWNQKPGTWQAAHLEIHQEVLAEAMLEGDDELARNLDRHV
jgi:hypothetical protein